MKTKAIEVEESIESTINLTADQIEEILKTHFKSKGYDISSVTFEIGTQFDDAYDHYGTKYLKYAHVKNKILKKAVL